MKILLIITSILLLSYSYGQNYAPFNSENPKRFQNTLDPSENNYFFYSIQTAILNDSMVFRQYLQKSSTQVDVTGTFCEGWGGQLQPLAETTWLGDYIIYTANNQKLTLQNSSSEILTFDFGLALGDSAVFYQSANENYYLKCESANAELVLNTNDNVKTFTIWKYNDLGQELISPLNGFEIKLSENLGLVSFIDCKNFPTLENGVQLIGQLNPTIGYYQMTFDEAFPWESGDVIQLRGISSNSTTMSSTYSYRFLNITNRIETADSVWIYYDLTEHLDYYPPGGPIQSYPAPYNWVYSNPFIYRKGDNVVAAPNNMTSHNGYTFTSDSVDWCGPKSQMSFSGVFETYCDSCNCFIPYDGFGQSVEDVSYVEQIGMAHQMVTHYGSPFGSLFAEVIYSNVDGVECGTAVYAGIDEHDLTVGIQPNPTKDILEISSGFEMKSLKVSNSLGSICYTENLHDKKCQINIANLVAGIYFLQIEGSQGQLATVKVVKD